MKGTLLVVAAFAVGCLSGVSGISLQTVLGGHVTTAVLYLLMFQVGLNIGREGKLGSLFSTVNAKLLLLPLATIVGTLSFSALAALILSHWSLPDCLAVGSGFAYYSLSSILITQLKTPVAGAAVAAELGTIALMTNVMREIATLLLAPFLVRHFGKFAPICAGGATTMDTTLSVITRCSGRDMALLAIFHGVIVDFSVPLFVSFFCSL